MVSLTWALDTVVGQLPAAERDTVAVSFDARDRLTYAQLHELSLRYARGLRELGLRTGDRLAVLLYNDAEYLPVCFAAMRLGVVVVRLNFRLAPAELRFILEDSGSRAVIVHGSLADRLEPIRAETGVETIVVLPDSGRPVPDWARPFTDVQASDPAVELPVLDGADPMSLLYTSGTTGLPKGALWSHANTVGTATMQALKWGFSSATVALVPGPLYHAGAFEAVTAPALLMHGTAVCLPSGSFEIEHLLDVVAREKVTDCLLFSFMLTELLRLDDLEERLPPSLRRLIIGGDTMMPWTVREVRRRMPGIRLSQVYGLTEGGAIATALDDADFDDHPTSVGRPLPLTEAKVVTAAGEPTGVDEVGEILVRGPGVCAGYWERPEANRDTFVDGWCRTGDLGSVDAQGFLSLVGRAKDMIRSGGENIYPAEIEKVLTDHPFVQDVAVIAVPDAKYVEVGCAVVVTSADVEFDESVLRAYCRERMASYKVPKYFVRRAELPRNASGKVLKYVLREQYAATDPAAPIEQGVQPA